MFLDSFEYLTHMFAIIKCFPHKALEKNDPYGPYFSLFIINVIFEGFWSHVGRRSHVIIQRRLLVPFNLTITEINYFGSIAMKHYVGWFEVSVNNSFTHQCVVTFQNSLNYLQCSFLL